MKDNFEFMLGLERVKAHFLTLLTERRVEIAHHVLAAWEDPSAGAVRHHLEIAQSVLHQIAGTAGSLGFGEFGQRAKECESEIIEYLDTLDEPTVGELCQILAKVDAFIMMSEQIEAAER